MRARWMVIRRENEQGQASCSQHSVTFSQTLGRVPYVLEDIVRQYQINRVAHQWERLAESGHKRYRGTGRGPSELDGRRYHTRVYLESDQMACNPFLKLDCPAAKPTSKIESYSRAR